MILRNHGVPGRHWVSLELSGTKSNRLAIGARIKLSASGMRQTEQIRSGGSYLSQSDLRAHFGLGTATKIDGVEIRWPSGTTDVMKNLESDKFYSVLEGKGVVPSEQMRPSTHSNWLQCLNNILTSLGLISERVCNLSKKEQRSMSTRVTGQTEYSGV